MNCERKYESNAELLLRTRSGDDSAVALLVRNNTGLVMSIARRFTGRGTELEDLIQIGQIGLLKAIRTFDAGRECAFSTYAVPLIFGEIRRFLRDDGIIKVSRSQKKLSAILNAERDRAAQRGEQLRFSELAERCGTTAEEAAAALESSSPICSLSDPISGEGEGLTYENTVFDEDEENRSLDRIAISAALDKLPEQSRRIILLRYFRDYSQQRTARELGITQVKVSREEKKILEFLRNELK